MVDSGFERLRVWSRWDFQAEVSRKARRIIHDHAYRANRNTGPIQRGIKSNNEKRKRRKIVPNAGRKVPLRQVRIARCGCVKGVPKKLWGHAK
jgi:hypothetical protein